MSEADGHSLCYHHMMVIMYVHVHVCMYVCAYIHVPAIWTCICTYIHNVSMEQQTHLCYVAITR